MQKRELLLFFLCLNGREYNANRISWSDVTLGEGYCFTIVTVALL
jgi:hypothetical protein